MKHKFVDLEKYALGLSEESKLGDLLEDLGTMLEIKLEHS
jgi:hypothetical protein